MNKITFGTIFIIISMAIIFAFIFWNNSLDYPQIQFSNETSDYLEIQNICLDKSYENLSIYIPYTSNSNIIVFYCKDINGELTPFELELDDENKYYMVGEDTWIATKDGGRKIDANSGGSE